MRKKIASDDLIMSLEKLAWFYTLTLQNQGNSELVFFTT